MVSELEPSRVVVAWSDLGGRGRYKLVSEQIEKFVLYKLQVE
jgi:hypothetical protein